MTDIERLAWFLRNGGISYNTGYDIGCKIECKSDDKHHPDCQVLKESLEDAEKILEFQNNGSQQEHWPDTVTQPRDDMQFGGGD